MFEKRSPDLGTRQEKQVRLERSLNGTLCNVQETLWLPAAIASEVERCWTVR